MNPKLLYLLSVMLLTLSLSSCDLDRFPKDSMTPMSYFSTESELALYTNQFYDINQTAPDMYGELADYIEKTNLPDEIVGNRVVPDEDSQWSWTALRHINYFLEYSGRCPDKEALNHYQGVAYFYRALFYFDKVKRFGDVPWYDKPLGSADEELYKARDNRKTVMANILIDIDKAINLLPETHKLYEVTKWTALALKSRICLFEGTYRRYHELGDWQEMLEECAKAGTEFIDNSKYKLYTSGKEPYRDLFASADANADEIIMARRYNGALGIKHNANSYSLSATQGRPGFNKRFVNHYLMADGSRFTDQPDYETMTYADETKNRDPRMTQTILCPGYIQKGNTTSTTLSLSTTVTGYRYIKYVMESVYDVFNASICDMPLYRTAEVYLNYAEAKAELGTLTQADLDKSVNKLRDRVNMPHMDLVTMNTDPDPYLSAPITGYPNVTQSAMTGSILEIRRERTIELCMEGFRYYDIMRWKEGQSFTYPYLGLYFPGEGKYDMNGDGKPDLVLYKTTKPIVFGATYLQIGKDITLSNGDSGNILVHGSMTRTFQESRDYLYPIPIKERVLTNGVLTQNPNWNDGLLY